MMTRFLRALRLIGAMLNVRMSRQMMYRASFWTAFFVDGTLFLVQIALFSTLFLHVDHINGWTREQMVFFVGTFSLVDGLEMCLYFFGVNGLPEKVRNGTLDLYLTRPISPLFHLTFEAVDPGSGFLALPGLGMVIWATTRMGLKVTVLRVAGYVLLLALMLLLLYHLMLILRTLSFWVVQVDTLNELEGELMGFAFRIPGVVFQGIWKVIFCVLLPYALLATIPTQFFTTGMSLAEWGMVLGVSAAFLLMARSFWKLGLARYGSTGS